MDNQFECRNEKVKASPDRQEAYNSLSELAWEPGSNKTPQFRTHRQQQDYFEQQSPGQGPRAANDFRRGPVPYMPAPDHRYPEERMTPSQRPYSQLPELDLSRTPYPAQESAQGNRAHILVGRDRYGRSERIDLRNDQNHFNAGQISHQELRENPVEFDREVARLCFQMSQTGRMSPEVTQICLNLYHGSQDGFYKVGDFVNKLNYTFGQMESPLRFSMHEKGLSYTGKHMAQVHFHGPEGAVISLR